MANTSTTILNIMKKIFVIITNISIYCLDACIVILPYIFQLLIVCVLIYALLFLCPFFILCLLFKSAREGIASAISAVASRIPKHFKKLFHRPNPQYLIYPLSIGDDGRIHYFRQFGNFLDEILDSDGCGFDFDN